MNILFLSGLFPKERKAEILKNSRGLIQNAADSLQWSLVNGFEIYFNGLKILTLPFLGNYPKGYKIPRFKDSIFLFGNNVGKCVGFSTLPILKLFSRFTNAKSELKVWSRSLEEGSWIIIYSIHSPFLAAAVNTKRNNNKIRICLIVPDLPQFTSNNKNIIYRILKKIDSFIIRSLINKVDSFVLLSDLMVKELAIEKKPWVRIEGISDEVIVLNDNEQKGNEKVILYSGTLASHYGILNLLGAFLKIENLNYRLWICGEGDAKIKILNAAKMDSRIKFYGQMPREDVLKLQKKATVLVNPRTSEGEFTKYSFPSKTMEYLASGTPCILNRLEGIPDEYYNHCFVPKDETIESLAEVIQYVCSKDQSELNEFGLQAQTFIKQNKSPEIQCRKIFNMLNQFNNENSK